MCNVQVVSEHCLLAVPEELKCQVCAWPQLFPLAVVDEEFGFAQVLTLLCLVPAWCGIYNSLQVWGQQ